MHNANLIEERKTRTIPSVVKWDGGGQSVFVTFDDGTTKIPMVRRSALVLVNVQLHCSN